MRKVKKAKTRIGDLDEYMRVNKSISRLEELERNGWRWVAKDRPHKNKRKYDRKRDRRVEFDSPNFFMCRSMPIKQEPRCKRLLRLQRCG